MTRFQFRKRFFALLLAPLACAGSCWGQALPANTPAFDTYGGFAAKSCPVQAMSNTDIAPAQLVTSSSTGVTPGSTTVLTLASVTETNGHTVATGEFLSVDAGSTAVQISTNEPFATGNGSSTSFTGYLQHTSWMENTLSISVGGTVVAQEVFGSIQSGAPQCSACSNALGNVTGHVSPDFYDSRVWVSIQFSTPPANGAAITLTYSYLPTEVDQVASVSGNSVTLSNPLYNAHSDTYSVTTAYFTTQKSGLRWSFCDPLSHPFLPISIENFNTQGNFGDTNLSPYAQNSVTTSLTQSITGSSSPQTVSVGSTSQIVAGPGMILDVGRNPTGTADNPEWVDVTSVGAGTISGIFKNGHSSGDTVECCQNVTVVSGGNGGNTSTGSSLAAAGKYQNSSFAALNAAAGGAWLPLNMSRLRTWGFNAASPAGTQGNFDPWLTNSNAGIWDLPEHTSPFKDPSQLTTYECSDGMFNRFGFASDFAENGNVKSNASGFVPDFFDANLTEWAGGQMGLLVEGPWIVAIMPTQTDNCPGSGPGEHFTTTPAGGFGAFHDGKKVLIAPPYIAVPGQVIKNMNVQAADPVSQHGTFLSKITALPQYLEGQLDPIHFPVAASGSNISSISCSGSNAVATLSSTWLGSHLDPFTLGDLITVSATGFSTVSGQPAEIITAVQGSHQITLAYPGVSPCPAAATQTSGLVAEGPGYSSVAALDSAWGAPAPGSGGYTTFGSSGTLNAAVPVSCSFVSGQTYDLCSFTANQNIDAYSVLVTASNGTISSNIAADFSLSSSSPPPVGATGQLDEPATVSTTTTNPINCTGGCASATFTLSNYSSIYPREIFTVDSGANAEQVKVISLQHGGPGTTYSSSVISVTAGPFSSFHSSGVSFKSAFGATQAAGTPANPSFTYSAASPGSVTVQFYLDNAPPSAFTLTAQYHENGWGNGGSGVQDEDGRCAPNSACSSHSWTGNDLACVDNNTGASGECASSTNSTTCSATTVCFCNAAFERDIDGLAQAAREYYARTYLEQARSVLPHTLVIESYRNSGARGDPSRPGDIRAQTPFVDIDWGSFVERYDGATPAAGAQHPCLSGGAWTLCNDPAQTSLDYMFSIMGDKPYYDFSQITADADSGLQCMVGVGTRLGNPCPNYGPGGLTPQQTDGFHDSPTQAARASFASTWLTTLFLTPTVNGSYQSIGDDWWSPTDTPLAAGQFDNYGVLSVNDNLYNGVEACNSSAQPLTENIAGYPLVSVPENSQESGEGNCYGDFLDPWRASLWNVYNAIVTGVALPTAPSKKSIFARVPPPAREIQFPYLKTDESICNFLSLDPFCGSCYALPEERHINW